MGANETVNGGAGTDVYNVTKTTIGNTTIKGGNGSNTLMVTGGGNATMGTKITGINAVQLATTTNFTANTTAGLQISGSSTGGDTITLGAPTQSVIAGGANETIKATAANAGASISGLGANSTLQITNGGTIALNAATDVNTVKLSAASTLTLNEMSFITAVGSSGNDTITAGGIDQTLTGGAGSRHADRLLRRVRHLQRHRRKSERRHHRRLRGQRHDRPYQPGVRRHRQGDHGHEWRQHEGHGCIGHDQVHVHPGRLLVRPPASSSRPTVRRARS